MSVSFAAGIAEAVAVVFGVALAGAGAAAPGDAVYASPGTAYAAPDGARLNLYCMGSGSPAVVFDSGHQDWAPAWALVQPRVARWTRACSYDRPGSGFSPTGPSPRSSATIAGELHGALHAAGVKGPYILVGHAFGGYNTRAFAYRYTPEVAGLVLLDTDVGDVEPADMRDDLHRFFVRQGAELSRCRDAVAKTDPAAADPPSPGSPNLACDRRFFRGFPDPVWSEALNARLSRMARTSVPLYEAVIAELGQMPADEIYLRDHRRSLGTRPVRVLTAADHFSDTPATPGAVHLRHLKREAETAESQARLLDLSSNAEQIFAYRSRAAYIQFDEPDLVVKAIREVYDHAAPGRH